MFDIAIAEPLQDLVFVGSGPSQFNMNSSPDNTFDVQDPTRMDRSPDGQVVFV